MATVSIDINGNNNASRPIGDVENSVKALKSALTALGVTWAALKVADYIKDAALMAARYETLGVTMKVTGNNAGYTSAQMDQYEASLRKTGIAAIEARYNLSVLSQAHIDLKNSAQLARIAQDAAVIGGINSSEAFTRLIYGIQSAQPEMLRTIGINVNFEQSYKQMSRQLGKSAEDLTEYEKVQARTNVIMEKGKDISGAYEAAMGTAGKQINSLKRYVDDAKVVLGSTFNDALLIAVEQVTGGLKDLNDEAGQMKQKGQLQQWGKDVVYMLAFVADAVRYPIIMFRSLADGLAIAASLAVSSGRIIASALKGDLNAASTEWEVMKGSYQAYRDDINKMWNAPSFQDQADKFYAARAANAAKDKALSDEAEQRRLAAGAAARAEADAKAKAEAAEKSYLSNIKNSIENIKEYADAVKDLGKERLTFSSEKYTDNLSRTVDLYKKGAASAADLITPLKKYNVEANGIFNERLIAEQAALDKVSTLYEDFRKKITLNSQTKEAKAAGVEILKAYRDTAEKIIAVEQDRYKTLLEGERATAKSFSDLIQAKKNEIESLKQEFTDANQQFDEQMRSTLQGGYVVGKYQYLDNSGDAYTKRMAQIDELRRKEAEYDTIIDPTQKQNKLKGLISLWEKLTGQVEVNGDVIITQEDAYRTTMEERDRLQKKIIGNAESEQATLEALYQKTVEKMETYKKKLVEIDDILKKMTSEIKVDLKVNGMEQIEKINGLLGVATRSPFASSGASSERVVDTSSALNTVNSSSAASNGDTVYTFSDGAFQINVQGTGDATQTADDLARQLTTSIKKYTGRSL